MAERTPRKLAVILHADVVGSTMLVQRDEALAHERIRDTFHRFSATIGSYNGHPLELRGDALVAEFDRASDAVEASLAFQSENTQVNSTLGDDIRPTLRVGISLGEVVVADNTVTGEGVVLAQRLEQLASGGGVIIQGAVYEAVPSRLPFDYDSLGEQDLKGIGEPVRAYAVSLKSGEVIPPPETRDISGESRPRQPTNRWTILGGLVLLVVVGGGLAWFQPWVPKEEPASIERMKFALPDKPSIAVLPFDNLSGDPEQEFLSDGITDSITTTLSKLPQLFVIARKSTFTYKGKPAKVQQVAEELGVRYVLEGSVQRSGERVRINVQLIDALSGAHRWAERYDRELVDLFALQDEIARRLVEHMNVQLVYGEEELAFSDEKADLDAMLLYYQALDKYERHTKADNHQARLLFEEALRRDPGYVDAKRMLAFAHWLDARMGWSESPEESRRLTTKLAKELIEQAPSESAGYRVESFRYAMMRDHGKAIAMSEKAYALAPGDPNSSLARGFALLFSGQFKEAAEAFEESIRLSPSPESHQFELWLSGLAYHLLREYEKAIAALKRALQLNPDAYFPLVRLAAVYGELGHETEARQAAAQVIRVKPNFSIKGYMKTQPFSDPAIIERYEEALRNAGLPE